MPRIFLSHVPDDGVLAHRLAEALRRAGHEPLLAEDETQAGDSVLDALERCLRKSDTALLCVSRKALADGWMQTEFQTVLSRLAAKGAPVLAARFERVQATGALTPCLAVDLFPQDSGWEKGVSILLETLVRTGQAGGLLLGNLPSAPRIFVNRQDALLQLREALAPLMEGTGEPTATLVGAEGMGRSATALKLAHDEQQLFSGGTWWCEARGRSPEEALALLLPDLQRLAPLGVRAELDLLAATSPVNEVAQGVWRALAANAAPTLLVLDDIEQRDWSPQRPAGRVSVLVTRHEAEGSVGQVVTLGPLPAAEMLNLLDALTPAPEEPLESEARARIAQELMGGNPFTLNLLGRLQQDTKAPWRLLEQGLRGKLEQALATDGTGNALAVLDEALDRCTPAMKRLLDATASFEASTPIPLEWAIAVEDEQSEETGLGALSLSGLMEWDGERETLALHPLVRQRVRERMGKAKREHLLQRGMEAMVAWLQPRLPLLCPENVGEVEEYQPQFQQCLQATEEWPPSTPWVMLALQTASILEVRADFKGALDLLRRALAQADSLTAPREQFICLVSLANVSHKAGRDGLVGEYLKRALPLADTLQGPDHDLAACLHVLALLTREQDVNLSGRLAERAVREAEALKDPDNNLTGAALGTLALVRNQTGDSPGALQLIQHALDVTQQGAGKESSFFVARLAEQGHILMTLGDGPRARATFEQALSIASGLLPSDSLDVGWLLVPLGLVLVEMNELSAAKPVLERAAGILAAKLGTGHPNLVNVLHNLGFALLRLGETAEAASVMAQAVELLEKSPAWDRQILSLAHVGLSLAADVKGDSEAAAHHRDKALEAGFMFYVPEEGAGQELLEKALRLARGRQVNPEAYRLSLTEALVGAERGSDTANAARAALLLGSFEGRRGAWETARRHIEQGLKLSKQAEAPMLIAESHRLLGDASLHGSRYEDARLHYAEAIRRWEERGFTARAARTRMLLLAMLLQLGRTEGSEAHSAALEAALKADAFTSPAERAEVEQLLKLTEAARTGGPKGPRRTTE